MSKSVCFAGMLLVLGLLSLPVYAGIRDIIERIFS